MDSEERALLAAIIANPEEDTPRLVYADWLQEHDRPERAELIRAQIGLARSRDDDAALRQRNLWNARVRLLLRTHSKQWRKELPRVSRVNWGAFDRGMIESAIITVRVWDASASAELTNLFEHAPIRVLRVHFWGWHELDPDECDEMLRSDGLTHLEELHLRAPSDGTGAQNPFFNRLWAHVWGTRPRVLDLSECWLPEEAVRPLLDLPSAATLPILVLRQYLDGPLRADLTARFGSRVRFV
jgi:uncharacterized protein (TIGR02996 family)